MVDREETILTPQCPICAHSSVCRYQVEYQNALKELNQGRYPDANGDKWLFNKSPVVKVTCSCRHYSKAPFPGGAIRG